MTGTFQDLYGWLFGCRSFELVDFSFYCSIAATNAKRFDRNIVTEYDYTAKGYSWRIKVHFQEDYGKAVVDFCEIGTKD